MKFSISAKECLRYFDHISSKLFFKFFSEANSLISFLFHGLFLDAKEISLNYVYPLQGGITVQHFRQFVDYYLNCGYKFIAPEDILNGLAPDKKYILITFDDGYFNNQYALPVLKEYKVPAIFFISTNNVIKKKGFWWDILFRERIKSGMSLKNITREEKKLKSKTAEEIERYIIAAFGEKSLKPICDIDRPFTPSELKDFSKKEYVHIGNHTADHAILTNYSPEGIRSQICGAQEAIYEMTGIKPIIFSFPDGLYSNEILKITREIGIRLTITTDPKKNHLPIKLQENYSASLGRFLLLGDREIITQCEIFCSDFSIYNRIKRAVQKFSLR